MSYEAFENLNLIPTILQQIEKLNIELHELKKSQKSTSYNLSTRKGVREYLNVTDCTINNMINDGRLKQGVHYIKILNGKRAKITFVESAIKEFKGV